MKGTVFDAFARAAAGHAGGPFLHIPAAACGHYASGALEYSYADTLRHARELQACYAGANYGRGQRIALLLENRPDFFFHWLALNALGASVVPLNAEQPARELAWLLEHNGACLVVSVPERSALAEAAGALLADTVPLWNISSPAPPQARVPCAAGSPDAGDECALLYTSGSTGKPKGCMLANDYFTRFGKWYRDLGGLCELREGRERLITPLPLNHMNAMAVSTMGMIMSGGCVVQLDRFHPGTWWQTVRDSGATIVHYLGVMPAILLNLPPAAGDDFSAQLRFGFGAGVNPRHHAAFEHRFGFPLIEAWAMTESGSGGCIIANREPRHVGSCCFGKPSAALEYRLVDESGADVPSGEAGELLVRASGANPRAGFFAGYLGNPAATQEIWAGGWLHTGDVVRAGSDGALHFVDRRKNVIRRSGENIAALEVEAALADDPAIAEVVVTGVPDEIRGEEVMACVVPAAGATVDADAARAIQRRALASLAYFKAPGYVVFVDEVPRTASQKPQRAQIKDLAGGWLASPRCIDLRALKKRPPESV